VNVDGSTANDLRTILTDGKLISKLTDFQPLFIDQQFKAKSVKKASGMRWTPAIIRLALSLSMTSPAAYDELSGILKLLSRRTIYDYSHALDSKGTIEFVYSVLEAINFTPECSSITEVG